MHTNIPPSSGSSIYEIMLKQALKAFAREIGQVADYQTRLVFLAIPDTLQSLFVAFPRHVQVLPVMITSGDTELA